MLMFIQLKQLLNNRDNKIILKNIFSALFLKGIAIIVSFLTLPAYLNYFEQQQILGLWFTILSVLTWIFVFDLGIGNGLRNNLVKPLLEKDFRDVKKYISSAYVGLSLVILMIFIIFLSIFRVINWNHFFNISADILPKEILNISILILFSSVMLQFLLRIVTSILFAMQKSALNNLLMLVSNILILLFVSIFDFNSLSTKLIVLSFFYFIAINLPLALATIIIFSTTLRKSKPNIKNFSKTHAKVVLKLGGFFFFVQILYMLLTTTNEILITWLSGPEDVVEFQIYNKLFTLLGTIYTLMLTPVWSMVTKAFAQKNYLWIKKIYKVFKILAIIIIIIQFSMIPFVQVLVDIWIGKNKIEINFFNSVLFAIMSSMIVWIGANNSIANGFGELKTQGLLFFIGVLIKFSLSWYLVTILESWVGVVLASIISLLLYCVIQPLWLNKYLNKKILEG